MINRSNKAAAPRNTVGLMFDIFLALCSFLQTFQLLKGSDQFPLSGIGLLAKLLIVAVGGVGAWFIGRGIYQWWFKETLSVANSGAAGVAIALAFFMVGLALGMGSLLSWTWLTLIVAAILVFSVIMMWRPLGLGWILLGLCLVVGAAFLASWVYDRTRTPADRWQAAAVANAGADTIPMTVTRDGDVLQDTTRIGSIDDLDVLTLRPEFIPSPGSPQIQVTDGAKIPVNLPTGIVDLVFKARPRFKF